MRRLGLLAGLPALLGAVVATVLNITSTRVPVVFLRADVGTLALLVGVGLSLWMLGAMLVARVWGQRARREGVAQASAQAADDRRRLLQRLDHELKNPLTAIRAGVANLSESPIEGARQEALGSVVSQTKRLSRLLADLRKLADLETRPLEHEPVDVGELLREVVDLVGERPEACERRLTLTVPQAPWPLPVLTGDRDLLFLAIHNLVDNALKFTQPGDTVEVRAFEEGTGVVIEVADTGPGVPDSEAPFVWEELSRGQAARAVPGTGLGLALVRAVVTRHGGQAAMRSRVGQGTVVTVRLPVG